MKNKAQMGLIVSIAIIILSGFIILGVWSILFSKADDASAEALCYGFNAVRFKTKVEAGNAPLFDVAPRTCRRIEKIVPSDDYPQNKEGAKAEISDMTARCWWMWLEGAERNMFRGLPGGKEPCFNCYSFNIKKGIDSFTGAELAQYMRDTAYKVKDASNNCAAIGGGFCADDCSKLSEGSQFSAKEVSSKKCEKPKKCCVSTKRNDECKNKGGFCVNLGDSTCKEKNSEYPIQYDGWRCAVSEESCCVKKEHYYSYFDYVQNYNDGKGAVLYTPETEFKAQEETYAISLISPDPHFSWVGGAVTLGSLLVGAGGSIALCSTVVGCVIPITVGVAAGGAGASLIWLTENSDVNVILIAPLNNMPNKCAMESDVTGP